MNVEDKVKAWAYSKDTPPPSQDYDLTLISLGVNELLLELASDDRCPKQRDVLSCLYLLVGDAVITDGKGTSFREVEHLLNLAKEETNPLIRIWIKRSRHLLTHSEEFDYGSWCGGSLAQTP